MSDAVDLSALTLAGIAHRCSKETSLFFRRQDYDPTFCYELFRRAILESDQQALAFLYTQYSPLVAGWVERHTGYRSTGEEVQYFVNRAFEKMWKAVPPERFHRFPDLKSLLRYLKMCTHSAIVDQARAAERNILDEELDELPAASISTSTSAEEATINHLQHQAFWSLIVERLNNRQEELVVLGSFILALKPRELYARFNTSFDSVQEVYRTKQNVLDRLRRDDQLRHLLQDHT